jgi:hypothetical protein
LTRGPRGSSTRPGRQKPFGHNQVCFYHHRVVIPILTWLITRTYSQTPSNSWLGASHLTIFHHVHVYTPLSPAHSSCSSGVNCASTASHRRPSYRAYPFQTMAPSNECRPLSGCRSQRKSRRSFPPIPMPDEDRKPHIQCRLSILRTWKRDKRLGRGLCRCRAASQMVRFPLSKP